MSTPRTPNPPTGPCGKWIHPTMDAAWRALRSVRKRKGGPEEKGSAYYCDACQGYHTTRQRWGKPNRYRDRSEPPARRRFQSG